MTPNIGQGANMAIEDAAALANALAAADLGRAAGDATGVEALGEAVAAGRRARTWRVCGQSELLTRVKEGAGLAKRLLAHYVLPALHDIPAGSAAMVLGGAPHLAFALLPARAAVCHSWAARAETLAAFALAPRLVALLGFVAVALWWLRQS